MNYYNPERRLSPNQLIDNLVTLLEEELAIYRKDINESSMGITVGIVKAIDVVKKFKENEL